MNFARRRTILTTLPLAGLLAACTSSSGQDDNATPGVASSTPMPTLLTATYFGEPTWGTTIPSPARTPPIVTGSRTLILATGTLHAIAADGTEAWAATWDTYPTDTRAADHPQQRLADPTTIAVIDRGEAPAEGLDEDGTQNCITLYDIDTGNTIATVELPGTLQPTGLAFVSDGATTVIQPDGSTETLPDTLEGFAVDSGATTGATAISAWGSDDTNTTATPGFGTPDWTSIDTAPGDEYQAAEIVLTDAADIVLGRWNMQGLPGQVDEEDRTRYQTLDATTGEVLALLEGDVLLDGLSGADVAASPNREHFAYGNVIMSADGTQIRVIGGGDQASVRLTAIADDGTAYGYAGSGNQQSRFARVGLEGEAETEERPDEAEAPVGIMDGGVAIHYHRADEATITGSPLA